MVMGLIDSRGNPLANDKNIYKLFPQFWFVKIENDENGMPVKKTVMKNFTLEKCENKHFGVHSHLFEDIASINELYCIPPDTFNFTLFGEYGHTTSDFSFMQIYINKCVNGSAYGVNDCNDADVNNKLLSNVYLQLHFLDNEINPYSPDPSQLVIKSETLSISSTMYKKYIHYFKKVTYDTDNGYVFQEHQIKEFFQLDSIEFNADLKTTGTWPGTFSDISMRLSPKTDEYKRGYTKIQNVVANIGGVIKFVLFLTSILTRFITQKIFFKNVGNELFYFKEDENNIENNRVIEEENKVKDSYLPFQTPNSRLNTVVKMTELPIRT